MKTYTFKVVMETDEGGYHAYCPALRNQGAVKQGATPEEALKNIDEVVQMIVDELLQDHISLPGGSGNDVEVFDDTRVAVTWYGNRLSEIKVADRTGDAAAASCRRIHLKVTAGQTQTLTGVKPFSDD